MLATVQHVIPNHVSYGIWSPWESPNDRQGPPGPPRDPPEILERLKEAPGAPMGALELNLQLNLQEHMMAREGHNAYKSLRHFRHYLNLNDPCLSELSGPQENEAIAVHVLKYTLTTHSA